MKDIIKVDFKDEDSFSIFYITDEIYKDEEEFKMLFKYLNNHLIKKYNKILFGLYDVDIYYNKGIYILDFNLEDDYYNSFSNIDFNVTLLLNTVILYEYEDIDLIDKQKIYYKNKFYTEIENIISDIRLFEYGKIIYGKDVEKVLNNGILFD